jgi:uncharacterized membrane protein YjgN (DUF898 family)
MNDADDPRGPWGERLSASADGASLNGSGASPAFAASPGTPGVAPRTGVAFRDESGAFFDMVVRGAFFQLLTFGFYRFWLITDMRRHLWSRTILAGDTFEYTGRAKELLIGFLVALAILTPVYALYAAAGFMAETVQAFASIPFFLFIYILGQFALYRARRYRLTRTIWRGVRFWVTGSGLAYAGRVALWGLAMTFTLGLVAPWRAASLERYKMGNTHYGDAKGDFDGTGSGLFKRVWWIYLVMALAVVPLIAMIGYVATLRHDPLSALSMQGNIAVLLVVAVLVGALLLPIYRAHEWRWWAEGASIGGARLASNLPTTALLGCYAKFFLSAIGVFVIGGVLIGMLAAGLSSGSGRVLGVAILVILYLVMIMFVGALNRYFLLHHYWRAVAGSLTVIGLERLEGARQSAQASSSLGEGFADNLDVGAF